MPLQFVSIRYCGFLIIGIVLGFQRVTEPQTGLWISGISLLFLGFLYAKRRRSRDLSFEVVAAICLIGVGMSAVDFSFTKNRSDHYSQYPQDAPELYIRIRNELRSGTFNNRFIADVCAVNEKGTQGKILISTPDSVSFLPDSELVVIRSWQAIRPPMNPGQFDFKSYMALQDIHHEIRLASGEFIVLRQAPATLMGRLRFLRLQIAEDLIDAGLTPETVATTEALLLGQRLHLDTGLYDAYKNAGAVHILAVSGLHIGILVLILKILFQPLKRFRNGDRWQYLVILIFLWAYALFTGLSPSVVRAVTLFSFVGYAWVINRPANMYNTLALSFFFVLLMVQPAFLFQAGFQMSYAAVWAIIWIYPKSMRLWRPKSAFLKRVWQILSVSLAAQLGVAPISLYYFHQFPGLFFLSNLLILPFLGIVLSLGILAILLNQAVWENDLFFMGYDVLVQTMNRLVEWIGSQETFIFREISFDMVCLILAYCLLITVIRFLETRKLWLLVLCAGTVLLVNSWTGIQAWKDKRTASLHVFHAVRHSLFVERKGDTLRYATKMPQSRLDQALRDYRLAEGGTVTRRIEMQNAYTWKGLHILIVDGSGVYPSVEPDITHIVLTQSPKIHLERLLAAYPDARIIADGSNYPSFVRRWQMSCARSGHPFHYTGMDRAYRF